MGGGKGGKGGYYSGGVGGYGGKGGKGGYYSGGYGGKGGKGGYYGSKGSKGGHGSGLGAALVYAYGEEALQPAYEKAPKPISHGMSSSIRSIDKVKQLFASYEGQQDASDETRSSSSTVLAKENDVPWSDARAPPTSETNFEMTSSSTFSQEQPSSVQGLSSSISAAVHPSSIRTFCSRGTIIAFVGALVVFALL